VPGNLYNQQYVLDIKEKTIDQYFKNIELEFYENNKYYTDSGTLSIEIHNLNITMFKNLFRIMNSFRAIIMEV